VADEVVINKLMGTVSQRMHQMEFTAEELEYRCPKINA
jgi:hypothetical protein